MKSLSPTRQRILQYALIDEYSSSEIAAKMQLSVQYANRIKKEFLAGGNLHEIRAHNTATVILDDHWISAKFQALGMLLLCASSLCSLIISQECF